MKIASTLHDKAMEFAEKADLAREANNTEEALKLFRLAFQSERDAAMQFVDKLNIEPTRSVLFRSAAALAIEAGEIVEAEKMISFGLNGNPPNEIRNELLELGEKLKDH